MDSQLRSLNRSTRSHAISGPPVLHQQFAAAGVELNGNRPWDIQVRSEAFFRKLLTRWELGLGESYMDGDWECEQLDELFTQLTAHEGKFKVTPLAKAGLAVEVVRQHLINLQSEKRAFEVGERHYDIGNDLFERMLDPAMIYSCAYWERATTLEQAQRDKLDMICRKLQLQPGERLLDVGCGWGGLARHAAEHYRVNVTGITVSKEQQKLAQARCAGLPVTIELIDYRQLQGRYDKIVSVGMFEHVGHKNYAAYFDVAHRLLEPEGLFLLHTIGNYRTDMTPSAWINKYIFPNGHVPSLQQIATAAERRFLIEDVHNFGRDYDRTLMAWWDNFQRGWPELRARYGDRFYRMWKYFLMSSAGYFRSRQGQLWQVMLSRQERQAMYRSMRPADLWKGGAS